MLDRAPNTELWFMIYLLQKQMKKVGKGVPRKRCSENMQQIYRRTPMPKYDFDKVALQVYWNHTLAQVFSCKFSAYFKDTFSKEHLWAAAPHATWIIFIEFEFKRLY